MQKRFAVGELQAADFKKINDRAGDQAVALQEEAGLEIVTDGEMCRQSFQAQMTAAVDGFGEHTLDAFLWGQWRGDQATVTDHRRSKAALRAQSQSPQRHIAAGLADPLSELLPAFDARRLCSDQAEHHQLVVRNVPHWLE